MLVVLRSPAAERKDFAALLDDFLFQYRGTAAMLSQVRHSIGSSVVLYFSYSSRSLDSVHYRHGYVHQDDAF